MPTDLLDQNAPDVEDFLCSWLAPLLRTAVERKTDDELPFCQVARISGADDEHTGVDEATVQLDIFDGTRNNMLAGQNAAITADRVHRRMMLLSREASTVTLSNGTEANADSVTTVIKPFRMAYVNDQVVRYVARYQLALSYVAV